MADPVNLQYQVRQNSEELQSFLSDLNKWEKDIQAKDKLLASSASIPDSKHPVRNKQQNKKPKPKAKNPQVKPKIKGNEFRAWDKYNVDEALKEIDEEEEMETYSTSEEDEDTDDEVVEQRRMQQALFEKEKGNELFKEGKYEAAINRYTTAIGLDPYNAILPANRAMALIKVQRYGAALQDCDTALALDNTYIKALARRATAKQALGKLEEALEDYKRVLELQPENKQALEGIEKIRKLLEKRSNETPIKEKDKSVQKPMKRYVIEEIGSASSDEEHDERTNNAVKITTQHKTTLEQRMNATDVREDSSRDKNVLKPVKTIAENTKYAKTDEVHNRANKAASEDSTSPHGLSEVPTSSDSLSCDLTPPVSSIQFETTWKRLEKNPELLYKYLKSIPPERLPKVIGESVESTFLMKILTVIREFYIRDNLSIFTELKYISQVKRFSMTLMFLSSKEKPVIKDLFDYLGNLPNDKRKCTEEDLRALKQKYGIR